MNNELVFCYCEPLDGWVWMETAAVDAELIDMHANDSIGGC